MIALQRYNVILRPANPPASTALKSVKGVKYPPCPIRWHINTIKIHLMRFIGIVRGTEHKYRTSIDMRQTLAKVEKQKCRNVEI